MPLGRQRRGRWHDEHDPDPHQHDEPTPARDPEGGSGLVGFAAIKYVAIVVIAIAILVFLAVYVIPALTD